MQLLEKLLLMTLGFRKGLKSRFAWTNKMFALTTKSPTHCTCGVLVDLTNRDITVSTTSSVQQL